MTPPREAAPTPDPEEAQALAWARQQSFPSVAARYAKLCALAYDRAVNAYDPEALKPEAFGDPAGPEWQRGELLPPEAGERLCEFACCGLRLSSSHHDAANPATCPDCKPATDPEALARLTAANLRLQEALASDPTDQSAEIERLTAENARLRAALDECLNVLIGCVVPGRGVDDRAAMLGAQAMARAALAGTP